MGCCGPHGHGSIYGSGNAHAGHQASKTGPDGSGQAVHEAAHHEAAPGGVNWSLIFLVALVVVGVGYYLLR